MIILLRHAESSNNDKTFSSYNESALLTKRGEAQAYDLIYKLDYDIDLILISSYIRTLLTVQPLLINKPSIRIEIAEIEEFNYLNIGPCSKLCRNKLKQLFWSNKDSNYRINEDSESFNDLIDRAIRFVNSLHSEKNVLVCSHKYFISAIRWVLLNRRSETILRDKDCFYIFSKEHVLSTADYFIIKEPSDEEY